MKDRILFNDGWTFGRAGIELPVTLPHTWNGTDGQDGGGDYARFAATYKKRFSMPALSAGDRCVLLFKGVNARATVRLNGAEICRHDGGYSAFSTDVTALLAEDNLLEVTADNSPADDIYPQAADFTFYGGIYRDVYLCIFPEKGFAFGEYCSPELKVESGVSGGDGVVTVRANVHCDGIYAVDIAIYDGDKIVATGCADEEIVIPSAHLWNGVEDPFMYRADAVLRVGGQECDRASAYFGLRTFSVDRDKGFILNGREYPLHGVSRHQDRPTLGNAISRAEHEEDIALIREVGANTVRLAHYQHDDYFYDLCDRNGLVVWAEIPYISRHSTAADGNAESQMRELVAQQYNHPSICFWGISNEITMKRTDDADMLRTHGRLNALCHSLDPSRLTTLACFAMCAPWDKTARITDLVGWNLYLGWYVPGLFLNDLWIKLYRLFNRRVPLCYSEYGAEGMPNIHSAKPKRFDNSEEYQTIYHEYMLRFFDRNPQLWATYVWNMFDFGADGRNQGGDPGKNHKGLVTFDRKTRKDAFYLYKAHWSKQPVLHLCGKRYINRAEKRTEIAVISNVGEVTLFVNGREVAHSRGEKVFRCRVKLQKENKIVVRAGEYSDEMTVFKVDAPDPAYKVTSGNSKSWEK